MNVKKLTNVNAHLLVKILSKKIDNYLTMFVMNLTRLLNVYRDCEKINVIVKFMLMVDNGVHLWYDIRIKGKVERKMKLKDFANVKFYSVTLERGYVSRKNFDFDEQEVHIAKGRRKGEMYILAPCYYSSKFCERMYFKGERMKDV